MWPIKAGWQHSDLLHVLRRRISNPRTVWGDLLGSLAQAAASSVIDFPVDSSTGTWTHTHTHCTNLTHSAAITHCSLFIFTSVTGGFWKWLFAKRLYNNTTNASTKIPHFSLTKALWTDCVLLSGELLLKFCSQSPSSTMVAGDECPPLKSNKMDLLWAAAALTHSASLSASYSLHLAPSHTPSRSSTSGAPHQSCVGGRSMLCNQLLVFNGKPPTWAACLTQSDVDPPERSAIGGDRHLSCLRLLCPLCVSAQQWKICCSDLYRLWETAAWSNKPALNYMNTRFVLDSSAAAWQRGELSWLTVHFNMDLIVFKVYLEELLKHKWMNKTCIGL